MSKLYTKNSWIDEVLSGAERYNLLTDGGTPIDTNIQINLATSVAVAGTSMDAAKMNNLENGLDAVDTRADSTLATVNAGSAAVIHGLSAKVTPVDADEIEIIDSAASFAAKKITWASIKSAIGTYLLNLFYPASGWISDPNTWTYLSPSSFTVPGDLRGIYAKGTRLRWTQTTVKYGVVASSSYNGGTGLTTVEIVVNTDHTIANAAISANGYSYLDNPLDWPGWFTFTSTPGGFSVNPTFTAKYNLTGKVCMVAIYTTGNGTSNATSQTYSAPVAAARAMFQNGGLGVDNGALTAITISMAAASSTINVYKGAAVAANWTNTGNKSANFTAVYEW